jgi:hypothetical protein
VLIKALYGLFVLCMAALVAVGIGVLLRVRRHWKEGRAGVETLPEQQDAAHPETDHEVK